MTAASSTPAASSAGAAGTGTAVTPARGATRTTAAGTSATGPAGTTQPTTSAGAAGSTGTAPTTAAAGAAASSGMYTESGPFFVSGAWHGYAFASAQPMASTIAPLDFSMLTAGMPRCVSGNVAPTMDYSGIAMLGVHLNQEQAMDAPMMTVLPTKAGLMVDIKNNSGSPLRIQVQTPNGGMNADERWCAPFQGSGFIPWKAFNTKCWDGTGKAYMMEPIATAMVLVPGDDADAVAFDFCLNGLTEADGAAMTGASGAAGGGGSPTAAAGSGSAGPVDPGSNTGMGTITDKVGVAMVQRDGRNYVIQNNVWGGNAVQHINYSGTTYEIAMQTGANVSSGSNAMGPVSYPSVFIGSNYNRTTAGSNLPIQISTIKSVKTAWSIDRQNVGGTYNASYDVWFSTGASGDPSNPSGGYLMVWYYKPGDAQPIGSIMNDGHGVTVAGVKGSWDVWLGPNQENGGRPVISYVTTQPISDLEFDLNAFIQDAVKRPGALQSSWYLSNVFAGFEIWNGGVGLKTKAFYAIVE
jgi:cellulose 1,4-beta-cellobiosidase